jgi:hypothetical protein
MLMTVTGCSVMLCYYSIGYSLFIYISTVSVSVTKSGPRCVVYKACGLSANTLIRLLTALFDQNTVDDKNVFIRVCVRKVY